MEAIMSLAGVVLVLSGTLVVLAWAGNRLVGRPLPEDWLTAKRDPWRALLDKPFILEQRAPANGHAS
ncbi:MAG TPA: hypothetical protein VGB52_11905 [Actinomycetota bacterium]